MKDKSGIINFIKQKLQTEYTEGKDLPYKDEAGFTRYGKNWAAVVSIDIVGFKKFLNSYKNEYTVKVIQIFTQLLSEFAQAKKSLRDIYYVGDEVIAIFDASLKANITEAIDFSFYANTICNSLIYKELIKHKFTKEKFSVGIGIWTSQDNSLVMIGNKGKNNQGSTTLIGNSINYASYLAKIANRNKNNKTYAPILMNYLTYNNAIDSTSETLKKWARKIENMFDSVIYEINVLKTSYNDPL